MMKKAVTSYVNAPYSTSLPNPISPSLETLWFEDHLENLSQPQKPQMPAFRSSLV